MPGIVFLGIVQQLSLSVQNISNEQRHTWRQLILVLFQMLLNILIILEMLHN